MGKTLQAFSVEQNGWVKGILLVWALGLLTLLSGFQAQAQATLPFTYQGPWATGTLPPGLSRSGLATDNTSELGGSLEGGSARFDSSGDFFQIELAPGSTPGTLTYYLNARNTFTTFGGEFVVEQAGTDGVFSPLETIGNNLSAVTGGTLFTNNPSSTTRYIRFRYADNKSTSHQILLDNINLVAATGPEINVRRGSTNIRTGGTHVFASQNLNTTSAPVSFTIQNTGIADLNLTSTPIVVVSGPDAALFTVDQTATANAVAANSSTTFTLTFTASSAGTKTAALTIANDDASEGSYVINLTATAADMPPTVSGLAPTAGKAGDEVTITGNNLFNVTSVKFGGNTDASFTVTSNSEIKATVPAGATTGAIVLATATNSVSTGVFTVYPTPAITAIDPTFGGVGMSVTLTGSGFTPEATIDFNGTPVVSKTFVNATTYTVTVPAGATTGPINIATTGGTASSE
ncbi:MAG: IPT/TIG domain-containing protein, partial [Adhaeribacter sp.]